MLKLPLALSAPRPSPITAPALATSSVIIFLGHPEELPAEAPTSSSPTKEATEPGYTESTATAASCASYAAPTGSATPVSHVAAATAGPQPAAEKLSCTAAL